MFCYKCGKKIEESAAFCPFCGTKQNTTGHNGNSAKNNASAFVGSENGQVYMGSQNTATRRSQMSDRNKLLIVIAGVVVVAVLVIIIIASNSRPTINMNDYLHVSDHGDDGHGSLIYSINYSKLKADYGGKLKLTSEGKSNDVMASAVAEGEDLIELIYDDISVSPENTRHLSNGDKVIFTWDTSDVNMLETYIMVSIEAEDYVYTVSNLEEAES